MALPFFTCTFGEFLADYKKLFSLFYFLSSCKKPSCLALRNEFLSGGAILYCTITDLLKYILSLLGIKVTDVNSNRDKGAPKLLISLFFFLFFVIVVFIIFLY